MIGDKPYDIFLCHSSEDKPEVRQVYYALRTRGFTPWIDEVDLQPGVRWRPAIEESLKSAQTAAVFVGRADGRVQDREIDICIDLESRGLLDKVIPVILPACEDDGEIDAFLRNYSWVDFRKTDPDPFDLLCRGIRETEQVTQPTIAVAPSANARRRSRLVVYAQSAGLLVSRAGIYPADLENAAKAFSSDLEKCDVVAHVRSPDSAPDSSESETEIARMLESYPHQKRILSWSPAQSTFSEFSKLVVDRAERAFDATRPNAAMPAEDDDAEGDVQQKRVMVKYHEDDTLPTTDMVRTLSQNNIRSTSSRNGKTSLAERMREIPFDALVVVLGECDTGWLEDRVDELIEVELTMKDQVPLQVYYYTDEAKVVPPDMSPSTLEIFGTQQLDKLCRAIRGE